jgi:hypothetical protein
MHALTAVQNRLDCVKGIDYEKHISGSSLSQFPKILSNVVVSYISGWISVPV